MDIKMDIIKIENIKNENTKIKIHIKTKCYEFWFIKNPSCFLWLWLISILMIAIFISEYYKNKKNDGSNII